MTHVVKPEIPPKNIKQGLEEVYQKKCAYCGTHLYEGMHIEHYRPKAEYDWLADSWDNMLLSCAICNYMKGTKFPIQNTAYKVHYSKGFNKRKHSCGKLYDRIEKPFVINPEREPRVERHFDFKPNGEIIGKTVQGKETINVCDLNREELIIARLELLNELKAAVKKRKLESGATGVKNVISDFLDTIRKPEKYGFLAFRKYILQNELAKIY